MKNQQAYIYKNFLVSLRSHSKIKTTFHPVLHSLSYTTGTSRT